MRFDSRPAALRRRPAHQRPPFLPRLEALEDRTALSTLTVTNTLDRGAGSLRDTLTNAKGGDTIVFAPALDGQTITLTSDELAVKKSLDIEGPGAGLLAISGNDTNRVFDISEGLTVTIAGLTIEDGLATGGGGGRHLERRQYPEPHQRRAVQQHRPRQPDRERWRRGHLQSEWRHPHR